MKKHALVGGVRLSQAEQQRLTAFAEHGDASAAASIAEHFLLVEEDYRRAGHWFKMAATHGGQQDKDVYRSFLQTMKELGEDVE